MVKRRNKVRSIAEPLRKRNRSLIRDLLNKKHESVCEDDNYIDQIEVSSASETEQTENYFEVGHDFAVDDFRLYVLSFSMFATFYSNINGCNQVSL